MIFVFVDITLVNFCKSFPSKVPQSYSTCEGVGLYVILWVNFLYLLIVSWFTEIYQYCFLICFHFIVVGLRAVKVSNRVWAINIYMILPLFIQLGFTDLIRLFIIGPLRPSVTPKGCEQFDTLQRGTNSISSNKCQIVRAASQSRISARIQAEFDPELSTGPL